MSEVIKVLDEESEEPKATPDRITALTCERFIAELSGSAPFPSGGSVAALSGAFGTALANMAASVINSRKSVDNPDPDLAELKYDADVLQADFVWLASKDASATDNLINAYSTGSTSSDSESGLQPALSLAADIALETVHKCIEALSLIERIKDKCDLLLVSGVASAAALAESALKASAVSVAANTCMMSDREHAAELNSDIKEALETGIAKAEEIYSYAYNKLLA